MKEKRRKRGFVEWIKERILKNSHGPKSKEIIHMIEKNDNCMANTNERIYTFSNLIRSLKAIKRQCIFKA